MKPGDILAQRVGIVSKEKDDDRLPKAVNMWTLQCGVQTP